MSDHHDAMPPRVPFRFAVQPSRKVEMVADTRSEGGGIVLMKGSTWDLINIGNRYAWIRDGYRANSAIQRVPKESVRVLEADPSGGDR